MTVTQFVGKAACVLAMLALVFMLAVSDVTFFEDGSARVDTPFLSAVHPAGDSPSDGGWRVLR